MEKKITLDAESQYLEALLKEKIIIYEDLQGSKLFVNFNSFRWRFKTKSISAPDMTLVDLAVQKYYNLAVNYFYSRPEHVKTLMDPDYWFCFEYFYDNIPAHIEYNKIPLNNLVLTHIIKDNMKKWTQVPEELSQWAELFNVDYLPILFNGNLKEEQIDVIKQFVSTSKEDLELCFGEINFAEFVYKTLSPNKNASFLMNDTEYNKNLEKVIIRFTDSAKLKPISIEFLNPFYTRKEPDNNTNYTKVYSLILFNFTLFMQTLNFDEIKPVGKNKDELYIDFMSKSFAQYFYKSNNKSTDWDFDLPVFYTKDKFRLNATLVKDDVTRSIVNQNPKYEYVFKVVLNSYNRPLRKPIGIMDETMIETFNMTMMKIYAYLDKLLNVIDIKDLVNQKLE